LNHSPENGNYFSFDLTKYIASDIKSFRWRRSIASTYGEGVETMNQIAGRKRE
jgi:hypothetical protein